jgi:putative ABC transport system substrate-binding protein
MRRRDLVILLAGAIGGGHSGLRAQQKAMPVIGILGATSPEFPLVAANLAGFRQGLGETGYVEGQNVAIEYRWANGEYDRLPAFAADLVARKVDVIVATSVPSALAAKSATSTIPIVFSVGDAVEPGLVASLARPGANLTGVSFLAVELLPKMVELLSELVPQAREVALLVSPSNPNTPRNIVDAQEAARAKGVQLRVLKAGTEREVETAFTSLAQSQSDALVIGGDPFLSTRRDQLVALASRDSVPAIYLWREFAEAGGLLSYGPSIPDAYRVMGTYAGRILKGEKAANLPVQQPTRFELVVNLKTAKALGLTVPPSILARADEVIE